MALVVNLRCVENLHGTADRYVKITFRGHQQRSKLVPCAKHAAYFGEKFEWPIARPAEANEQLRIVLLNSNKYLSNRSVGSYTLLFQALITEGHLKLDEPLADRNNRLLQETISFEVYYYSPDGTVGDWGKEEFCYPVADSVLEADDDVSVRPDLPAALEEVQSLRPHNGPIDGSSSIYSGSLGSVAGEDTASQVALLEALQTSKRKPGQHDVERELHRSREFQVCVRVLEVQQLAGLNVDPVVRVQVGDVHKYTSIKQSTNCPYYNEYFVFDFFLSPALMFDKIITISVCDALSIPGRNMLKIGNVVAGKVIGAFKCDVGTVYAATEHHYYHKWAVLLDTKDLSDGAKGYVKCDIAVLGKGDPVKIPKHVKDKDTDDIEGNLLLPVGVSLDRQRAVYTVTVFEAQDLPQTDAGIMASVRKVIGSNQVSLLNAYVRVSFLGHVGKTSKKKSVCPRWREVIQFMDMFPPLCNRLKLQLCDSDTVSDETIATHNVELAQIMDPGSDAEGILPTFGPNWVYFYGSALGETCAAQNRGESEGCAYRGRLLISISTQILAESLSGPACVYQDKLRTTARTDLSPRKEFILFGTIFQASMINKEYAGKPIYFELSIGMFGNTLNPSRILDEMDSDSDASETAESRSLLRQMSDIRDLPCESSTVPQMAQTVDNTYYFVPIGADKPCMYVAAMFEDITKRLYHLNLLSKIAKSLAAGVSSVRLLLLEQHGLSVARLRSVLAEFAADCQRYIKVAIALNVGVGSGKTKLDRYRLRMCKNNVERLRSLAIDLRHQLTDENVKEKFREARSILQRIQNLAKEPQQSMPDVFIWMICGKKRVAYHRIAANDLIHASQEEYRGEHCGKTRSFFLKKPGKLGEANAGWAVQAKLEMYMWLGKREIHRAATQFLESLPEGYELRQDDLVIGALPPTVVTYKEYQTYQLCAHLSQARSLIGSDDTGLSDPFARVILYEGSRSTRVVDETLSPVWNETLCLRDLVIYGSVNSIVKNPPLVVIEFYDHDRVGQPEFLGRTLAYPRVKSFETEYQLPDWPPQLEWWDVQRGPRKAGQLLAAFELLQGQWDDFAHLRDIQLDQQNTIIPIPPQIKPTLSKYRIEVAFWGIREPRRVQLFAVDRPRVDLECAGQVLQSRRMDDFKKNNNFDEPLKYMDVELPDNETYWPPITIRCVDCRKFGREVLVGTCTVTQLQRYVESAFASQQGEPPMLEQPASPIGDNVSQTAVSEKLSRHLSVLSKSIRTDRQSVVINMDERCSLKTKPDDVRSLSNGKPASSLQPSKSITEIAKPEPEKTLTARQRKVQQELIDDLDWWSKYYVTKEDMQKVNEVDNGDDAFSESDEELLERDLEAVAVTMVDYRSLDKSRMDELQSSADKLYEESLSKKKQKKRKKLRAKERLKKLKGIANDAFLGDEGEEQEVFDDDIAEDKSYITRLKIYPTELECMPEFGGFTQIFQTFDLYRGKKVDDSEDDQFRVSAKFKGAMRIYRVPDEHNLSANSVSLVPELRLLDKLPNPKPFELQVLVYVVQATDLHPVDLNGKADPYLVLNCGRRQINDKNNRQNRQLNPVFGRLFEFDVKFPMDSLLRIQVMDYDSLSADDLIGETVIDLENRFFSEHRATCGLQAIYDVSGYNVWRDPLKPSEILANLCKQLKMAPPEYKANSCSLAGRIFHGEVSLNKNDMTSHEHLALAVLREWHTIPGGCRLVPEHVETRTLYCAERPGIEQGKIEMWVDMFPKDKSPPTVTVDITPRQPKAYHLRCVIWNTSDVKLEDSNMLTGEESSDIFVRGYVKGMGEDDQKTDVHYRSLTGEGNFNWRFVFPFDYLKAEERIMFCRKDTLLFDFDESQMKIPAKLTLQVWDADLVSADDYLGAVTLDLNRIPRPAKNPKHCTERLLATDGSVPTINLFKNLRCRGWWPMIAKEDGSSELVGKVEMELHLVTEEEAEKSPVGLGREEPEPLPSPNRPDTSFLWFMNPLKTLRYIIWKNFKWTLLKLLILIIILLFVVLFFYSAPGATVDKLFGV